MNIGATTVLVALAVLSCHAIAAAEAFDPRPREAGRAVLWAANAYLQEVGRPPESLEQLVPKYLSKIPRLDALTLDRARGEIYYGFNAVVVGCWCSASIGDPDFTCECK